MRYMYGQKIPQHSWKDIPKAAAWTVIAYTVFVCLVYFFKNIY